MECGNDEREIFLQSALTELMTEAKEEQKKAILDIQMRVLEKPCRAENKRGYWYYNYHRDGGGYALE